MQSMSLPLRLWSALAVAFACALGVVGDHAAALHDLLTSARTVPIC